MKRIFKNFFFSIALLSVVTIQAASTPTKTDDLEPCNKRLTHEQPVCFNDIELSLLKKIEDGDGHQNSGDFWIRSRARRNIDESGVFIYRVGGIFVDDVECLKTVHSKKQ